MVYLVRVTMSLCHPMRLNVYIVVSVGMRIAYRYFPDGLMTGTPSQTVTENPKPPKTKEKASQKSFTTFDLEKLHTQLDSQLSDRSVGSKSTVLSLHFHLIWIKMYYLTRFWGFFFWMFEMKLKKKSLMIQLAGLQFHLILNTFKIWIYPIKIYQSKHRGFFFNEV